MPDCMTLLMQLNALRTQQNTLASQLLSLTNQLNGFILGAMNLDNFGGTLPSPPVTMSSASARIAYLDGLIGPSTPQATIDAIHAAMAAWGYVLTLIPQVASKQAEYDAKSAEVEAKEDEAEIEGCL